MERLTTCFTFRRCLQKQFLIRQFLKYLCNYFEVGAGNELNYYYYFIIINVKKRVQLSRREKNGHSKAC